MGFRFEKLKVLVVEDTVPMQELIAAVLDTLGVGRIVTASNGETAFKVFCREKPDIIITDWHMEPMDGISLIEKVRTDRQSPNKMVPVIVMSGYSAMPRVIAARDNGATEFLVKPFSAHDLAKRIAHVIVQPRDFIDSEEFFGPDRRRRKGHDYNGPARRGVDYV